MKIMGFIKSLLPHLDKDNVLEDVSVTKTELNTGVIPAFNTARTAFKTMKISSKESQNLQKVFRRNYDVSSKYRQENMIGDIADALPRVAINLEYVETQIEDLFSRDILRDGLSARKVVLVRAADQISFISKMAIDVLNLLYVYEAEDRDADLEEGFKGTKKVRELVEKNIFIFGTLLKVYGEDEKEFKALISSMPDTIINDKTTEAVMAVYKEYELDPMSASMVQEFDSNPIYHIRLMVAEWQANRYKRFSDKKKMLELRLLHLKMMNEDKSSESLKREIEYIQGRVDELDYKLNKMEND